MSKCKEKQGDDVMIEIRVLLLRDGSIHTSEALVHKDIPMQLVQSSVVGMVNVAGSMLTRSVADNHSGEPRVLH